MDDIKGTEVSKEKEDLIQGQAIWAQQCLITGADFANRRIYLVGEISDATAYRFMVVFSIMDSTPGLIKVFMNTPGGEETNGYAIYDMIAHSKNRVETIGVGSVMSISSAIFQAGDVRSFTPETIFAIHNGSVDMEGSIPQDKIISMKEEIDKGNAKYHKILSDRSGKKLSEIKTLCEKETIYTAEVAVREGFADRIIEGKRFASKTKKIKKGKSK